MSTWTAIELKQNNATQLPKHLQYVVDAARAMLNAEQVILFGSRARGDARENSDFDIAIAFENKANWPKFVVEVTETVPSLYQYDIVDIASADPALKQAILKEGVVLYDRKVKG